MLKWTWEGHSAGELTALDRSSGLIFQEQTDRFFPPVSQATYSIFLLLICWWGFLSLEILRRRRPYAFNWPAAPRQILPQHIYTHRTSKAKTFTTIDFYLLRLFNSRLRLMKTALTPIPNPHFPVSLKMKSQISQILTGCAFFPDVSHLLQSSAYCTFRDTCLFNMDYNNTRMTIQYCSWSNS